MGVLTHLNETRSDTVTPLAFIISTLLGLLVRSLTELNPTRFKDIGSKAEVAFVVLQNPDGDWPSTVSKP